MDRAPSPARLLLEADLEEPATAAFAGGRVAWFTRPAPGKPGPNEDGLAVVGGTGATGVLAVADGLGGMEAGSTAARLALEALAEALDGLLDEPPADADRLRSAILSGIERANERVLAMGVEAGTTLAIAEIAGGRLRTYHVGDSPVWHVDGGGAVRRMTTPHSPVGYAVEAGLLDPREALFHAERHLVFNMVGSAEMKIEVSTPISIEAGDTVLVTSDGLVDNLFPDELLDQMRATGLDAVAANLVELARARMVGADPELPCKPDDLTLLLYRAG